MKSKSKKIKKSPKNVMLSVFLSPGATFSSGPYAAGNFSGENVNVVFKRIK